MEMGKRIELHNQVYHMDCMKLLPHIPDGAVSMILTDPPYGISYQNHYTRKRYDLLEGDHGIDYEKFALGKNILNLLIIQHGRRKTRYTTQQLRIRSACPG